MNLYYISSSSLPSRAANSIHTINMCNAFKKYKFNISLFLTETKKNSKQIKDLKKNKIKIKSLISPTKRGIEFLNCLISIAIYFCDKFMNNKPDIVISRNIFGAYFFHFFTKTKIIYETHIPELGIRGKIQNTLFRDTSLKKIVISEALLREIFKHHKITINNKIKKSVIILHDGAFNLFSGKVHKKYKLSFEKIKKNLSINKNKVSLVGYFGHLHKGRGIELILELAKLRPNFTFLIFGGAKSDIEKLKKISTPKNLYIMGFYEHEMVRYFMTKMDVLLMPYQKKVFLKKNQISTEKWMSPLKLFEYMSSKKPIVSSNIRVLKEVLENKKNSLLVESDNKFEWVKSIDLLINNKKLSKKLAFNAYTSFKNNYTWDIRAKKILEFVNVK